jgi:hypothetical protein
MYIFQNAYDSLKNVILYQLYNRYFHPKITLKGIFVGFP